MIDIHSHLLFGVDDGAKTLEESIDILKDMSKFGLESVILTPHYIKNSAYCKTKSENLHRLHYLQNALEDENVNINLYLGNEIFIDDDILELLRDGKISSLNDTEFLLIEIPMNGKYDDYKEIFASLISQGYKVVLAHPERYLSFQRDFNKIYELDSLGVYFQCNLDSLIGGYGDLSEKTVKRILKEKMISFLATDIHHKKEDYAKWEQAKEVALKYISEEEWNILVNKNPRMLLS